MSDPKYVRVKGQQSAPDYNGQARRLSPVHRLRVLSSTPTTVTVVRDERGWRFTLPPSAVEASDGPK